MKLSVFALIPAIVVAFVLGDIVADGVAHAAGDPPSERDAFLQRREQHQQERLAMATSKVAVDVAPIVAAESGMGNMVYFTQVCSEAGAVVTDGGIGTSFKRVHCENNAAVSVFYGGVGVPGATPAPCISNAIASCPRADFDIPIQEGGGLTCRTAGGSGNISVGCWAAQ